MKTIIFIAWLLLICSGSKAQELVRYSDLRYEGYSYHGTLNGSFINKRITFLHGADSVFFNIKVPFSLETKQVYDPGIFYNCVLKKDTLYSFELKKATSSDIPSEYNSYYRTNAQFSGKKRSRYTEIKKDTPYQYQGNTGMFVDIDHELYRIEKMTPTSECVFQH